MMLWKLTADTKPATLAGILHTVMPGRSVPGINQLGPRAQVAATTVYDRPAWMERLSEELSRRHVRHEVSWMGSRDD